MDGPKVAPGKPVTKSTLKHPVAGPSKDIDIEFSEEENDVCKICHHVDPQSDDENSDDEDVQ